MSTRNSMSWQYRTLPDYLKKAGQLLPTLLVLLSLCFSAIPGANAGIYTANSYATLISGISSASNGDTINFTANVVVSAEVAVSKSLVFQGNGYTITVTVPGLNDAGLYNASPSTFRVFSFSGGNTMVLNRLMMMGGAISGSGGAVTIASGTTVRFNQCSISNSRANSGGGINNNGHCFLNKSFLTRNAANYGGGFLNSGGTALFFIEYSTVTENRSLSGAGGGGGCENNGGAGLYVNNASFSNNQSTELGGAINNLATARIVNTSFTGNIAYGAYKGGAIAQNSGTPMMLVNCLFGYNYYKSAPASGAPTTLTLNDVEAFNGTVNFYYCTYMAATTTSGSLSSVIGNDVHLLAADGSTNDLFTGGSYGPIFDATGAIYGTASCFQPILVNINGMRVPTLKTGSYALAKGCIAGFTNGSGSPVVGYKNMTTNAWTDLSGSGASGFAITDDETALTRAATPAAGALEKLVDNYFILKVRTAANGAVDGASIYGEVYPSGTAVTMTAIANSGYAFTNWTYNEGGSGTLTANPLTLTLSTNTTLTPAFASSANYTVTYLGNGNTGGTTPGIGSYPTATAATISGNTGSLVKTSFTFDGWNTSNNGSGTDYAPGATYSAGTNLVLYAKWASTGVPLPLPMKLISFTAYPLSESRTVAIKWATGYEMNNAYFEAQRSPDGIKWETVRQVNPDANAGGNHEYAVNDEQPYPGISFYRLKQVDVDGKMEFSSARKVFMEEQKGTGLKLYPNPVTTQLYIENENVALKDIQLYDNLGRNVTQQCSIAQYSDNQLLIDCSLLPNGIYTIRTASANTRLCVQHNH